MLYSNMSYNSALWTAGAEVNNVSPGNLVPGAYDYSSLGLSFWQAPDYASTQQYPLTAGTGQPNGPMAFDMLAASYVYGANTAYHAGDTVYTLTSATNLQTIWDAGGSDTLDASGISEAVILDLTPMPQNPSTAWFNGANINATSNTLIGGAYMTPGTLNSFQAVVIENATGGSGNDLLIGNSVANVLNGGGGNDLLIGLGGNDTLNLGSGGNDIVGYSSLLNQGQDSISNFTPYANGAGDLISFNSDAATALDDGWWGVANTLSWSQNTGSALNLTNGNFEAVYINFTAGGMASSSGGLTAAIATYLNTGSNAITAAGADALFVVATNDNATVVYSYLETNSVVEAADFTLLATITGVAETYAQAQTSFALG